MYYAASSLANKDKKILLKKKINLYEMYGATEIGTVTSINFNNNKSLVGSVGKILKNIDIKIIDENNKFLKLNSVGEIVCKTPLRFKYYYNNKNLTKNSFILSIFKTGDIGRIDQKNNLYFISKNKMLLFLVVKIFTQ